MEARKLPYLQAVIKEGLRIFPPVTGFMSKEVPPGGDTIKGLYLPEKTTIGWSSFGLMRNEKVWGDDAKVFRPERWLEGSPEEIQRRELDVEMVFGYGKYQCLGKNIAYMELNKIFVQVCGFSLKRIPHLILFRFLSLLPDLTSNSSFFATLNSVSWTL